VCLWQVERVEQTQLEITLWDKNSDDGFLGEVLLNVSKLQQIMGKYFGNLERTCFKSRPQVTDLYSQTLTYAHKHWHTPTLTNTYTPTEHSFPVKTSSVYNSRSRAIGGTLVLGLSLDAPV